MAIYIGKGTNEVEKTATLGGDASVYISDSWNDSKNYITGDYAIYENNLWRCKANNSNTVPTEGTYWTRVLIADEIETLNENLVLKRKTETVTTNGNGGFNLGSFDSEKIVNIHVTSNGQPEVNYFIVKIGGVWFKVLSTVNQTSVSTVNNTTLDVTYLYLDYEKKDV